MLCGPLLGGLLVATVGAQAAFVGNAATFLVSAGARVTIRRPAAGPSAARPTERHDGLMAGFRFLAGDRVLRTIAIAWSIVLLGIGAVLVAELPAVQGVRRGRRRLRPAHGGLGRRLAARRARSRRAPCAGMPELMCITVGAFVMAITIGAVAVAPVLARRRRADARPAASPTASPRWPRRRSLQRRVPDAVRGRVVAAIETAVLSSLALSFGFAGFLLDAVGPRMTYLVAGVVFAIGARDAVVARAPLLGQRAGAERSSGEAHARRTLSPR